MKLKLLQVREATGNKITSVIDVVKEMKAEAKADRECMWVLHLNSNGEIIEKELASMGCLNFAVVVPREIFRKAVINSTDSIITVHNHPSGNAEPSMEDRKIWHTLKEAGVLLGIKVLDNLIITSKDSYSETSNSQFRAT